MRKLGLLAGLTIGSFASSYGAGCQSSSSTTMQALNALGAGVTCSFGGLNFSNFFFSGYNDSNYSYHSLSNIVQNDTYVSQNGQANTANYLVTFNQIGTQISLTFSPSPSVQWTVSTSPGGSSSVLAFELKYTVSGGSTPNSSLTRELASTGNVTGPNPAASGSIVDETLINTIGGGTNMTTTQIRAANTYAPTVNQIDLTGSPSDLGVTNNYTVENKGTRTPQTLTATSFTNTYDTSSGVPEPASSGLIGLGVAGFAVVRKRFERS